jgi:hypothetical protein
MSANWPQANRICPGCCQAEAALLWHLRRKIVTIPAHAVPSAPCGVQFASIFDPS